MATRRERGIRVHAPVASTVEVVTGDGARTALRRVGPDVAGTFDAAVGDRYSLVVDGGPLLLDPHCLDVDWMDGEPVSVVRDPWARREQGAPLALAEGVGPVVYEAHVRGFHRTFAGMVERLDHIAGLGVDVIELMPVHPFDPSDNYWGYMPLVWGAVHRPFAAEPAQAAEELADLVAAVHERGMHVWLDVVFNHTGEGDATLPTRTLRGLDDANAYRHRPDGSYTDDSGCGNDVDPGNGNVRRLVLEALDRLADLGIDGFRFDLASLLTRDGGGLIAQITGWAFARGVTLIAEPWDLGAYMVGDGFPDPTWLQWNDRFRDDVRGLLRGEPGLVPAMIQRITGSPDLFPSPLPAVAADPRSGERRSAAEAASTAGAGSSSAATGARTSTVNFVTAHDGLTMHDLTIVTDDHFHAWDCGESLRLQQLKNYFTVLLLSAGAAMFVMGDEVGRTQGGNPNPYDVDGPVSWFDWERAAQWGELHDFVKALLRLRRDCPPVGQRCYGVAGAPDTGYESRSIAWATDDLYVMVNAWWEPLTFEIQEPGEWTFALATVADVVDGPVPPRSIRILRRVP
ncbi:MAG: alpha-amylase family glycosyl hydrolase [Ilumatobacteraceae bacterium]